MNITLIGMAGVGKSVIGKRLAEVLGYKFVDIDEKILGDSKKDLQEILNELGDKKFIELEGREVSGLRGVVNTVISPGGSVVYSQDAMNILKKISKVIYLEASFSLIEKRIDVTSCGIVGLGDKTIEELFRERVKLYEKYADITMNVSDIEIDNAVSLIQNELQAIKKRPN